MRRLLLLGGMTPDVSVLYYNIICRVVRERLGARHGPKIYLYSADLEEMVTFAGRGDWTSFAREYTDPIVALSGRVDGVVCGAILAHKVARQLSDAVAPSGVPLLHIADFLSAHLKSKYPGVKRLGLLGPKATMLGGDDPDWFIGPLQRPDNGFTVIIPETEADVNEVNRGMLEEVAKGIAAVTDSTKAMFVAQAKALVARGAQAIILGSTDLGFALRQEDVGDEVPIIEPAAVHAEAVANWACDDA
jgi:aspartate racemase